MTKSENIVIPEGFKTLSTPVRAEDNIGPFYYRKTDAGLTLGFYTEDKHSNAIGSVHGGVLTVFADYAATMVALSGVKENCATVSLTCDFIGAARLGNWIEAQGEVSGRTGSMTFVSGKLTVMNNVIVSFQAVMRRLQKTKT